MTDRVFVESLEVFAHHGVSQKEKEQGQTFVIDIDARLDLRKSADTGAMADTFDYVWAIQTASSVATSNRFDLIETLAERIAGELLAGSSAVSVRVRISKPQAPIDAEFAAVGVEVERSR